MSLKLKKTRRKILKSIEEILWKSFPIVSCQSRFETFNLFCQKFHKTSLKVNWSWSDLTLWSLQHFPFKLSLIAFKKIPIYFASSFTTRNSSWKFKLNHSKKDFVRSFISLWWLHGASVAEMIRKLQLKNFSLHWL